LKLLLDASCKLNYDAISPEDTVQTLLDAVDVFLDANPLPCFSCAESCCKKPWAVEVDNVFVHRHTRGDEEAAQKFVRERLKLRLNRGMGFHQYVLDKKTNCDFITEENRCRVYGLRPVICRLYVCTPKSYRYNQARELVAATYLQALVFEENMSSKQLSPDTLRRYRRNPVLGASDYSCLLHDIFNYAIRTGWLIEKDRRELAAL
jgi:Fe-S-cluster containining protein